MERLSIREVIEHCNRQTEITEMHLKRERLESMSMEDTFIKRYWEHRQVAEWLEELQALKDKQEQGLLKILPCPIGTLVHEPYKFCGDGAWEIDHHYLKLEDLDKIGKTVFVDENDAKAYIEKAEAEEALAKMGE